jgi:uncharacterized protein (TIGR02147 family)
MPGIFDYFEYRLFLKDYYQEKKAGDYHFSHQHVASKLGCNQGYLTRILNGQRHISSKLVERFVILLDLKSREADYFRELVKFNKAKNHEQKKRHFQRLMELNRTEMKVFSRDQYELFNAWYHLAIREAIAFYPYQGNYAELADMLVPKIRPLQARKSVELLERLGLIKKNGKGIYERVAPVWTTGEEVRSVALVELHRSLLDLAKDSLENFNRDERESSNLTMSVSEKEYRIMIEKLRDLRTEFLQMAKKCDKPDRIYELTFSIFPLTKEPYKDGTS